MTTARGAVTALALGAALLGSAAAPAAGDGAAPELQVRPTDDGGYEVAARFRVDAPAPVVHDVLTDYEQIPRFLPGVERSRVLEREAGRARVAQEAVSKYLLFSKRVHLLLDITEEPAVIRFTDSARRSFKRYAGAWTLTPDGTATAVGYALAAEPAFSVPGFVLRRLVDRDARAMIDGLRAEVAARIHRQPPPIGVPAD